MMNKKHAAALTLAVLAGCALGATFPSVTAQTFAPNPAAPRFEQFCESVAVGHGGPDAWGANVSKVIGPRGAEGFELVSLTSFSTATRAVACYKRPISG